jgi:type IV pilus assembly protein PilF
MLKLAIRVSRLAIMCGHALPISALLAGCAVTSLTGKNSTDRDTAALHLQNGTVFFENRKYPSALNEFLQAERLDPNNPVTHNNLAMTYFVRERVDLAMKHINRAIELNPKYSEARNNRARILIERGLFDQAIIDANLVVQDLTYLAPIRAWNNIALAEFRAGRFKNSKKTSTEALKIDRSNCAAQTILGRSHLELGELKDAAETFDRAILSCKLEGEDEAAYFAGFTNYKLGRSAAAVSRLEHVLKDYPEGRYAQKAQSLLEIIR